MSTDTTPADLDVPAAALARHDRPHRVLLTDADVAGRIRDVAAPVVAAELRRLADEDEAELERLRWTASCYSNGLPVGLQPIYDRHHLSMMRLRRRADELDGGA